MISRVYVGGRSIHSFNLVHFIRHSSKKTLMRSPHLLQLTPPIHRRKPIQSLPTPIHEYMGKSMQEFLPFRQW